MTASPGVCSFQKGRLYLEQAACDGGHTNQLHVCPVRLMKFTWHRVGPGANLTPVHSTAAYKAWTLIFPAVSFVDNNDQSHEYIKLRWHTDRLRSTEQSVLPLRTEDKVKEKYA